MLIGRFSLWFFIPADSFSDVQREIPHRPRGTVLAVRSYVAITQRHTGLKKNPVFEIPSGTPLAENKSYS
jgi:hypothetical protein